jgi:hypothetical protein
MVNAYRAQKTYTTKRTIPISSVAETTPIGPSTRTGKVHNRYFGFVEAFLLQGKVVHYKTKLFI